MTNNYIKFGSINTKTGLVSEGFVDKCGNMCYKKPSLVSRIKYFFGYNPLIKKEFLCIANKRPVYREFNLATGETVKIWTKISWFKVYADVECYEKTRRLVEKL